MLMQLVDNWDIDFAGLSQSTLLPFDYNGVLQQNVYFPILSY